MTLYYWMHWFWITFYLTLVVVQSQPTLMSSASTSPQYFINESSIPPTTEKPYKFAPKKHLIIKNTTATASSPRLTVIEENFTIPLINNDSDNDNDTLSTAATTTDFENSTLPEFDNTSPQSQNNLSAAGITGITMGCIGIVGILCGVSFVVYRNRGLNRPQVLNDRCSNPDSSGYIDDASIRDNSEEMYSLDNDSFLNSLEAMTIQNYWTDTVKHTKL